MSEPTQPTTADDLPQPFSGIGEPGWAQRTRDLLEDYGVPLPARASEEEIRAAETRLAVTFPASYRLFQMELGPVDLDGFRFLPVADVVTLERVPFREFLADDEIRKLPNYLGIVEHASRDLVGLNLISGDCALCRHDPPGFSDRLASFEALAQLALMSLPASYYGWLDEDVIDLVERTQMDRFGTRL